MEFLKCSKCFITTLNKLARQMSWPNTCFDWANADFSKVSLSLSLFFPLSFCKNEIESGIKWQAFLF